MGRGGNDPGGFCGVSFNLRVYPLSVFSHLKLSIVSMFRPRSGQRNVKSLSRAGMYMV